MLPKNAKPKITNKVQFYGGIISKTNTQQGQQKKLMKKLDKLTMELY